MPSSISLLKKHQMNNTPLRSVTPGTPIDLKSHPNKKKTSSKLQASKSLGFNPCKFPRGVPTHTHPIFIRFCNFSHWWIPDGSSRSKPKNSSAKGKGTIKPSRLSSEKRSHWKSWKALENNFILTMMLLGNISIVGNHDT